MTQTKEVIVAFSNKTNLVHQLSYVGIQLKGRLRLLCFLGLDVSALVLYATISP